MPSELERRLERALNDVPVEAFTDAHDRARDAALAAAAAPAPGRLSQWRVVIAAAVAMVLVTTGVTLAATGDRPFSDTATLIKPPRAARPKTGLLPQGARAFSILADGRAWVALPRRVLLRGAPRSAIAVSPGAVYVLEAHGRTLRAVAAGTGRVAQTQRTAGRVSAAVWSPFPIRIAYLTEVGGHQQLHDEWGTLSHDYLVDRHVAAVAPSWRWDSLAVAYVRGDGRVVVHSATSGHNTVIHPELRAAPPTALAFAPTSGLLAIADRTRLRIVDTTGRTPDVCGAQPGSAQHRVGATPPAVRRRRCHALPLSAAATRPGHRYDHRAGTDHRAHRLPRRTAPRAGTGKRPLNPGRRRHRAPVQRAGNAAPRAAAAAAGTAGCGAGDPVLAVTRHGDSVLG